MLYIVQINIILNCEAQKINLNFPTFEKDMHFNAREFSNI